jgi:glycosyltransferase involved in cell wall biosynthesis
MPNSINKRRILVVGPGANSKGGITAVIRNYGRSSFWTEFGCVHFSSTRDGYRVGKLGYAIWRFFLFLWTILVSRPTAISLHTSHGSSFARKFCYLCAARMVGIPVVLHVHPAAFRDYYNSGSARRRWFVRLAGQLSERIVFLSTTQLDAFRSVFSEEKMSVISNPVDVSAFSRWRSSWQHMPCQILYLGWITREKGVYDLVDAIPEVVREYPHATFVFGGTKELARLRQLISEKGLGANAQVVGWVEGEERLRLLRTSRVLVLPSYSEGVPNVILEAMAARVPVIATPVGGVLSVVQDGVTGVYVQPGDVAAISAAICRLLRNREECERLAANAHGEVSRKYDIEVIAGQLRQLYGSLA